MKLDPVSEKLVLHWGDMGSRWGINRTVAQIHALLYFSARAWAAEDIVKVLGVARSHVSNSLHELQSWGVIKTTRTFGDRRDYFESVEDVWKMFEILLDERKRREMDPTLKALREASVHAGENPATDPAAAARLKQMLEFFELMDGWFDQVRRLPLESRVKLVKFGSRISHWLK